MGEKGDGPLPPELEPVLPPDAKVLDAAKAALELAARAAEPKEGEK